MNGEIAQLIAVTCHANAFLTDSSIGEFFPGNSTCKFCEYVRFADLRRSWFGKIEERQVAATPDEWFRYLTKRGIVSLILSQIAQNRVGFPDRMSAAFVGGGGVWLSYARHKNGLVEPWRARWEIGNREASNQRIWRVTYTRISDSATDAITNADLPSCERRLRSALQTISIFAREQNSVFTDWFAKAIECLDGNVHLSYHNDLAPEGFLSPQAYRVLLACQNAWVFGGMGSWNDMLFEGGTQERYNSVSEQLFASLNEAIVAAVNTGTAPNGKKKGGEN
jgi:hypothetical protein